jgi:RNA recognition motif-containing protein
MNIYVSNLGFQVNEEDLKSLFAEFGDVSSVKVITDRETGRSRGFAFVEMDDQGGGEAIKKLDGRQVDGRAISVSVAKPKPSNGGGGGFNRDRGNRW